MEVEMQNSNHPGAPEGVPSNVQGATIGIIGLGRMGQAFGDLLMSGGARVIAYDLEGEKLQALARRGATPASGMRDFAECEMVLTSLPDDDVVRAVVLSEAGLACVLRPGSIHLSTSTIGVAFCRELDAAHRKVDQYLVAMPVFGNPDMAAQREIFILLGGATEAIERCRAVIERLGQRSFHVGDQPWLASAMKLAGNMLTAATLQSMGEAFAFLAKVGVPPERAQEILTGSLFDGHVHKAYGRKIVDHHYTPPGMTVALALKDLRLLLAEAEHSTVPMPLASLLHDRLVAVEARGWSELDWSALGQLAAFEAGIS
jgi:3-hydroxyisobutyrate dehydrogenase-like beta-hydroxyacid dehydrogenase